MLVIFYILHPCVCHIDNINELEKIQNGGHRHLEFRDIAIFGTDSEIV